MDIVLNALWLIRQLEAFQGLPALLSVGFDLSVFVSELLIDSFVLRAKEDCFYFEISAIWIFQTD